MKSFLCSLQMGNPMMNGKHDKLVLNSCDGWVGRGGLVARLSSSKFKHRPGP